MECPICQDSLGCPAFTGKQSEDSEVPLAGGSSAASGGTTAFRLKCGHAFHSSCLCQALRGSGGCPVCRDGPTGTGSGVAVEASANLVIDADGNMHLEFADDTTGDDDDSDAIAPLGNLGRTAAVVAALDRVARSPEVQNQRTRLNRELRRYRHLEATIMQRRRTLVSGALRQLRAECLREFDVQRRSLQRAYAAVKRAELAILGSEPDGASLVADIQRMAPNQYTLSGNVNNDDIFGPLKHRFWHH